MCASVKLDGVELPVKAAWVIVGPPNYAPDVIAWRTLYDLLVDSYVQCGWLPFPDTPSFTQDVLPALRRLSNLQWVNKGFAAQFGKGRSATSGASGTALPPAPSRLNDPVDLPPCLRAALPACFSAQCPSSLR